jgi:hypothetical protein
MIRDTCPMPSSAQLNSSLIIQKKNESDIFQLSLTNKKWIGVAPAEIPLSFPPNASSRSIVFYGSRTSRENVRNAVREAKKRF